MPEVTEVKHFQIGQRYKVVIEQIGNAKGTPGFKIEANSDSLSEVAKDAETLLKEAQRLAETIKPPEIPSATPILVNVPSGLATKKEK